MEEEASVPKLRFHDFAEGCETYKMLDLYSFKVTNSLSRDNLTYASGKVKNIHYGDIHVRFHTLFDITKEHVPYIKSEVSIGRISADNYCREGDMIFADASEDLNDVGKAIEILNLDNQQLLSGLHTILARPVMNKLAKGFGGYLFRSNNVRTQIRRESQGTKVLSISMSRLRNILLTIPEIAEQQKIAAFLTAVDDKMQQLSKKKSLLEQYKKGVMQQIFNQEIRFKDENGEDYPGWEVKMLGDVVTRVSTKNNDVSSNVLTISAQEGLISQLKYFNNSVSSKNLSGYTLIMRDDFAYNKSYSKGYPMGAIKRLTRYEKGIVSTLYICFRTNKDMTPQFAEHYFESGRQNQEIEKVAQEGARNHGLLNIGVVDFFSILVDLPSVPEQTKIANFLSALDDKIKHVDQQIELTKQYKKGLLQQMFV